MSIQTRFTLFGIAFGFVFPVLALALDCLLAPRHDLSLIALFLDNPVHWIVALAPIVLGATFSVIGRGQARLERQLALTAAQEKALRQIAHRDSLTGCGSRHSLMIEAERLREAGGQLLVMDLDKFKFVNDTLGHHVGDRLLAAFAQRVTTHLGPRDRLYRLGGDEFVALLPACDEQGALAVANRLVEALHAPFPLAGGQVSCGCSIGIAALLPSDEATGDALARADLALLRAKKTPGSAIVAYDEAMGRAARERVAIEREIRRALEEEAFSLVFQPIVNIARRQVRGFEALVRWDHPERGRIMPDAFIPIAEASGLIVPLGSQVLGAACREAASWPSPLSVSVNVSVEQFAQPDFCQTVARAIDTAGLPPGRLILEITESLFVSDMTHMRACFERLRRIGVRFALDDFGTGFSSINHLRQLDLDFLKLDRSFVSATADARMMGIVRAVMGLAASLDLVTVIEGIECEEHLAAMAREGIEDAQGYLFARPMPGAAIPAFLRAMESRPPLALAASG